ncbi:hypothetical protein MKZ38_000453 [Zalerion maritima]|uniref:DUF7143 domain-containing protein n=1 Tax=Zalerion maritima TaxID=339359 RepID=A0AAD5S016_9PEZI|nr:hypothetical protein MKZ38_000453 [Zalerion maritima]
MKSLAIAILALGCVVSAAPTALTTRQDACFVVGDVELPAEVADIADSLASVVSCGDGTTIGNVPDVISGDVTFSSIDFSQSDQTPLAFSLSQFATSDPLADNDLDFFQNELNTYLATEAGVRSEGGNLAVKTPKFFLEFQVARILTAQGNPPTDPSSTVEHKLEKVLKLTTNEDQALIDELNNLAVTLA